MSPETSVERLLRWRLLQAEADTPPCPRASRLLELARPWWETWPEQFRSAVDRLCRIQNVYGYAMTEARSGQNAHAVPALLVIVEAEQETFARVLYFSVRDGWLRLRFRLEAAPGPAHPTLDVTFVSEPVAQALFSTPATLSVENEYRLDVELPDKLAATWGALKVTDQMPFRLILRTEAKSG